MSESALDALITALRRLPGVGVKSAQRMAFHLLQHDREGADRLASALQRGLSAIRNCTRCRTFTEEEVCRTCLDPARDASLLCIVESPADQAAMERSGSYHGLYFVLMGRLSPLDGMGARDIGLQLLLSRAADPQLAEVILATSFTAEGDVTAHVIADTLRSRGIRSTRLARGVPIGSELEHVDAGTIAHALHDRR